MQGSVDKLTRLRDEEFLDEGMLREIKRAERYHRPLAFLFVDPVIPDEIYQEVVYPVLKRIALIIRKNTRYVDIGVRLGQQILILLPETNRDGAVKAAVKLKKMIEDEIFNVSSVVSDTRISIKIGIATYPEDGKDTDSILEAVRRDVEIPLEEKTPSGLVEEALLDGKTCGDPTDSVE